MKKLLGLALALFASIAIALPAVAFECPEDRTVYIRGQNEISFENRHDEEPFGLFLILSTESRTVRFTTIGGGNEVIWRGAYLPATGETHRYLIRDDQHLEFDDKVFSPVCR